MGSSVDTLLARLRFADRATSPVALLLDDAPALEAALGDRSDDLLAAVEASVGQRSGTHVALVRSSFASLACDADGRIVVADAGLADRLGDAALLESIARQAARDPARLSVVAAISGRPMALAAARWPLAQRWPLSEPVITALRAGLASIAIVTFRRGADGWERAGRAFGLTPAELRLAETLTRHGDLKRASAAAGIAYETGRKLLAAVLAKVGATRQADAVRVLLATVAGDTGARRDLLRLLADLFGLNDRQAKLAIAIGNGATREAAAYRLGISAHAAKEALRVVFDAFGVGSAAELSRLLAEIDVLAGLATACDVQIDALLTKEPLRLVRRSRAAGHIAVSDHGPKSGKPVLYLHAQMQGRHLPRVTVRALQQAGIRPIAIERAGFGLTDWVAGDFAETAMHDLLDVLDAMALEMPYVLARGGITPLLRLVEAHPDRIVGGLLLDPGVPAPHDRPRPGLAGLAKRLMLDPKFVRPFVRALTERTGNAGAARLHRAIVRGSPADERALDDPDLFADIVRATRQAAIGCDGFLHESIAHLKGMQPTPVADGSRWRIMMGAQDPMFDVGLARAYWFGVLPGAAITVVRDGGRWLHASHPDLVAKEMQKLVSQTI